MAKSKYTPSESYSLVLSNTEHLLKMELESLRDSEIKIKNLKERIELSKRKINDFEATINILKAHPGITWEIQ